MDYTGYIDTHAHILFEDFNLQEVIERAKKHGVSKILIICITFKEAYQAIALKKEHPEYFDVACGIHPSDIADFKEEDYLELEEIIKQEEVCAVGEIGLDYHWHKDNKEEQRKAFLRQIDLANKYNKPVLIHTRDAIEETFTILEKHPVNRKGIMHCYSSSWEMAQRFIKLGFYISLGGPVTFKNAVEPKRVASNVPLDRLFVETDSPFLAPTPFRGKRNEPMYVRYTYEAIAQLKGIDVDVLIEACQKNYQTLFQKEE